MGGLRFLARDHEAADLHVSVVAYAGEVDGAEGAVGGQLLAQQAEGVGVDQGTGVFS